MSKSLQGPGLSALAGWLAAGLAVALPARAATVSADLDGIHAQSSDLASRAAALEADARAGAFLTESEAAARFEEYVYRHLVGDDQVAAEGLYALVTSGALTDEAMRRDAEWYLAEALEGAGNLRTAAVRYQAVADRADHPFRSDAVRRLLELYARSGERDAFDALYRAEILSGRVQPTGLITYSVGKSLYLRGDWVAAVEHFSKVPVEDAWYARALYFRGTIAVRQGELAAATNLFRAVAERPTATPEDRDVRDLALLAIGRIAYEQADYTAAGSAYNEVGVGSRYEADKLYEMVWTSVRQGRWHDALNNVDVFLLAYPEHQYTGRLKILRGHLAFQDADWQDAIGEYQDVLASYAPVQSKFEALAEAAPQAEVAVRAVNDRRPDLVQLPPYAVAMMKSDPDLAQAMALFRELDGQRRDIEASEAIIAQLRAFVDGSGAIGSFERQRTDALVLGYRALDARVDLLEVQERWLGTVASPEQQARLGELAQVRQALARDLAALGVRVEAAGEDLASFERQAAAAHQDGVEARREVSRLEERRDGLQRERIVDATRGEALATEIESVERDLGAARTRATDADVRMASLRPPDSLEAVSPEELDGVYGRVAALSADFRALRGALPGEIEGARVEEIGHELEDTFGRLASLRSEATRLERAAVPDIRDRFQHEVQAVAAERVDYEAALAAFRRVSASLTRAGFGRLEDFFADAVQKADMGIVDAFWAQKLEADDELERVRQARESQLRDLEDRFRLIREKMGEAR